MPRHTTAVRSRKRAKSSKPAASRARNFPPAGLVYFWFLTGECRIEDLRKQIREFARAGTGALVYGRCGACHGPGAVSAGMAPDLRASAVVTSADGFARVVRDGTRANRGMPAYGEMTDQQLVALRHYIRQQAERGMKVR